MTDGDAAPLAGTARERAKARVRALLDEPLRAATDAGFLIVAPLGEIVAAVESEMGDAALRLPRYYPVDEGQPWLLGQARRVDPDSGQPLNMYARWQTGLPNGRMWVQIVEAGSAAAAKVGGLDLAEFVAAPDALAHTLRALLAACEHSAATVGGAV